MRTNPDVTLVTNLGPRATIDDEAPLRVLKFGGSVLRSVRDLPRVAGEIYRQVRAGARVIAVVSAFEGETDALLQLCRDAAGAAQCAGIPDLVSLGEEKSAQLLRIGCERIGLRAEVVRPERLGILTEGDRLEGVPVRLTGDLAALMAASEVLIVPGYVGVDRAGRRTLLGRGGTDFSAIFIAGETGAGLRLCKDVDGVYDHDPAKDPRDLARYDKVSWAECLTIARPLLQPRAVEYASRKKLPIEVGAIGSASPTLVSAESRMPAKARPGRRLRIGLAGFGTVGQALKERLKEEPGFEIAAILVRDPRKRRTVSPGQILTADTKVFFESGFEILVDATTGAEAGRALCIRHLAGMHDVVSANKAAIAANLRSMVNLSGHWGGLLRYSAAVGGSAPMLEMVRRARARAPIRELAGILNGTVNFMLDEMGQGASFETALERARWGGFAEADPSADLSGMDAAAKLRILAFESWGQAGLDIPIDVQPLDTALCEMIAASGERWLQISSLRRIGARVSGSVLLVPSRERPDVPAVAGEWNHLIAGLDNGECLSARGRGAGGSATAEAIMADLFDIASGQRPDDR